MHLLFIHTIFIAIALTSSQLLVQDEARQHVLHEDESLSIPGFHVDLNEQRLLQLESGEQVWVSEMEKLERKIRGERFFDITNTPTLGDNAFTVLKDKFFAYPSPRFNETVQSVLKTLSTDGPKKDLKKFSSYKTRYYRSDSGKESQEWLLSHIVEITNATASSAVLSSITVRAFPHPWPQSSIILRINGTENTDETVVIGAHQDSTNLLFFLPAPGADDDGSGTVTILEALRGLLASGLRPRKNVEFHWYSAEEGGLLGSQAIAQEYLERNVNVYAMIQMDMTAWVKRGTREEVGVVTDYVDPSLTHFIKALVDAYLRIPYVETRCGYACSDHASWMKAGYRAAFTIESDFKNSNNHIHSTSDTIDVSPEFSFDHMLEFSKLAVAFAVELGEWQK